METSNFYLASAVVAKGFKIDGVDRGDPSHVKFLFKDSDSIPTKVTLKSIEDAWDDKTLEVNAREYAEAIREVKMKIHQE
jgi:hypothetical protein